MSIANIIKSLGDDKPRLNELGKIKIGGLGREKTAGSGRTYRTPEKHDAFTITTLHRQGGRPDGDLIADADLMKQLCEQYADADGKLRQIPIRLLSDDIDDVLQTAWVWYGRKSVGARSDGETLTWFYNPENNQPYNPPVQDKWGPDWADAKDNRGNRLFKLHSVFNCVIAAKEARWGGVYKFRTTSMVSFKQLYSSLLHISQLTSGILRGMPLMLCVRPIQVSPEGKTTTVYVAHVELRGADLVEIQRLALDQARWAVENKSQMLETQRQYKALLVAPGTESAAEAGDIGPEFHPESQVIESAPADYDLIDDAESQPAQAESDATDASQTVHDAAPVAEPLDVSTWDAFAKSMVTLAIRDGITEPIAEAAIRKMRLTDCGSTRPVLATPARQHVIDAIRHGAFDWSTAQVDD